MTDDFTAPGWTIELESGWDDDGWTRVPTNITRDTSLSWKAKGLVAFLAGHTRGFRITREFIIRASSDGETAVRSGLRELRDAGYLTYRRAQGTGAYVLSRFPRSVQQCGKPPQLETNHVGNHGQKKTKFQVDQLEEDQQDTWSSDDDRALPTSGGIPLTEDVMAAMVEDAEDGHEDALFVVQASTPKAPRTSAAVDRALDEEFDGTFWPAYPRKVGKEKARLDYRRARRKGATFEDVMAGLRRFVADKADTEARFIAHASTWLNGGRWMDEPDKPAQAVSGRKNGHRPYQNDDYWSTP